MRKEEKGDWEFEVEKIVGKRNIDLKENYLVKWKNYSLQNTWEPIEKLTKVQNLIDEYEVRKHSIYKDKKPKTEEKEKARSNIKEVDTHRTDELIYFVPMSQEKIELNPRIVICLFDDKKEKEVKPVNPLQKSESILRITKIIETEGAMIAFVEEKYSDNNNIDNYNMTIEDLRIMHPQIIIDYFIQDLNEQTESLDIDDIE